MTTLYLNLYIAEQLMRLKSATGLQAFVTTSWSGIPVMITWNVLASEIMQIWPVDTIVEEDLQSLSNIIKNFLQREL